MGFFAPSPSKQSSLPWISSIRPSPSCLSSSSLPPSCKICLPCPFGLIPSPLTPFPFSSLHVFCFPLLFPSRLLFSPFSPLLVFCLSSSLPFSSCFFLFSSLLVFCLSSSLPFSSSVFSLITSSSVFPLLFPSRLLFFPFSSLLVFCLSLTTSSSVFPSSPLFSFLIPSPPPNLPLLVHYQTLMHFHPYN